MLTTHLPATLRAVGFTEAQVTHAMRAGGPLDYITHRTWCEDCNRSVESTLREMLANNGTCKCGGRFHVGDKSRDIVEEIAGRLVPTPGASLANIASVSHQPAKL